MKSDKIQVHYEKINGKQVKVQIIPQGVSGALSVKTKSDEHDDRILLADSKSEREARMELQRYYDTGDQPDCEGVEDIVLNLLTDAMVENYFEPLEA